MSGLSSGPSGPSGLSVCLSVCLQGCRALLLQKGSPAAHPPTPPWACLQ